MFLTRARCSNRGAGAKLAEAYCDRGPGARATGSRPIEGFAKDGGKVAEHECRPRDVSEDRRQETA
jgi:hypothetical protein